MRAADERRPDRNPITTSDLFTDELSQLRKRLGWTQAELGAFFGVSYVSVSRWENRGVGETEARKAVVRMLGRLVDSESGQSEWLRLGDALREAGVVKTVTAGVHQSRSLHGGGCDEPIGWRRIFRLRSRLGWTQVELARFLGVTHSTPAVWERLGGEISEAMRAALLALDLTTRADRPEYPVPNPPPTDLKSEGLNAFYEQTVWLRS